MITTFEPNIDTGERIQEIKNLATQSMPSGPIILLFALIALLIIISPLVLFGLWERIKGNNDNDNLAPYVTMLSVLVMPLVVYVLYSKIFDYNDIISEEKDKLILDAYVVVKEDIDQHIYNERGHTTEDICKNSKISVSENAFINYTPEDTLLCGGALPADYAYTINDTVVHELSVTMNNNYQFVVTLH